MKKATLLLLLMSAMLYIHSQDLILTIGSRTSTVKGKDFSISGENFLFSDITVNKRYSYPLWNLKEIVFNDSKEHDITLFQLTLDTIQCQVESFGADAVFYKLSDDSTLHQIENEKIFGVFFENSTVLHDVENYIPKFLAKQSLVVAGNIKIVKKDGTEKQIHKPINTSTTHISYFQKTPGATGITVDALNNIERLVHFDSVRIRSTKPGKLYVVNLSGAFFQGMVNKIGRDEVNVSLLIGTETKAVKQQKKNISGIMYYNYPREKTTSGTKLVRNLDLSGDNLYVGQKYIGKISVSGGLGYRLAEIPSGMSSDLKEFYEGMRLGAVLEASMAFHPSEKLGFVFKINHYRSSNTGQISQGALRYSVEESLFLNYFGVGLSYFHPLNDNRGFYNMQVTGGYLSFKNDASASISGLNSNISAKGESFGFNISQGLDFQISSNAFFGIQLGVSLGSIQKVKIDGQTQKLNTPESLARIEGLTGFRIYF